MPLNTRKRLSDSTAFDGKKDNCKNVLLSRKQIVLIERSHVDLPYDAHSDDSIRSHVTADSFERRGGSLHGTDRESIEDMKQDDDTPVDGVFAIDYLSCLFGLLTRQGVEREGPVEWVFGLERLASQNAPA